MVYSSSLILTAFTYSMWISKNSVLARGNYDKCASSQEGQSLIKADSPPIMPAGTSCNIYAGDKDTRYTVPRRIFTST